jgi:hypothetical protein
MYITLSTDYVNMYLDKFSLILDIYWGIKQRLTEINSILNGKAYSFSKQFIRFELYM